MAKKIISFEFTCEGNVVAPITKHYSKMNNDEIIKLKEHLIFHEKRLKVKKCKCAKEKKK